MPNKRKTRRNEMFKILSPINRPTNAVDVNFKLEWIILAILAVCVIVVFAVAISTLLTDKAKRRGHPILLTFLIMALLSYGLTVGTKFIYSKRQNGINTDGIWHPIKYPAMDKNVTFDTDIDWANFGTKIIIHPKSNIEGLKLKIKLTDNNDNQIYLTEKDIGDVKKDVDTTCTITISEVGVVNSLSATRVYVTVSGGTIFYFSPGSF